MPSTHPIISNARIETVREILLASGWSDDGTGGYLAPTLMRDAVAQQYGRGHLHLWDAINTQMRFDSFVAADATKAA